jgi:hypothetical protein
MKLTLLALALTAAVLLSAPLTDASVSGTCGFIRASTPYSRHGRRDKWRVYITGATSCRTAQQTLDAVMHLEAKEHLGADEAHSFFTYRGWSCPFGDMGSQSCVLPARRSPKAQALALDCAVVAGGCPTRVPPGYFG